MTDEATRIQITYIINKLKNLEDKLKDIKRQLIKQKLRIKKVMKKTSGESRERAARHLLKRDNEF